MTPITGPYSGVEAEYRRRAAQPVAVDWFGE